MYWKQACTRAEADQIMLLAMIENDVPPRQRRAIYQAVRRFGNSAWKTNAAERAQGRIRILPEDRIEIGPRTLWPIYQRRLIEQGVGNGPDTSVTTRLCARGSMTIKAALETP